MDNLFPREGKKGEMIKQALELFATRGYDSVSVRDIAKAAGVSEAALYKHFKGKEDMALYIFSAIIKAYSRGLLAIEARESSAIDKLCMIVEFTYDVYQTHPAEIRFALLSQYLFWDHLEREDKPHLIMKNILEAGMRAGEIAQQEVYFLITIYSGVMLQPLAQYPYFNDVLPDIECLKDKIIMVVRKLFS